jgi:hypothetical protein
MIAEDFEDGTGAATENWAPEKRERGCNYL